MKPVFLPPVIINSFYDKSDPHKKKINPALIKFSEEVAKVAVLDFSEKELRAHYEKDFHRAHITYVKCDEEIIAFFIAVFSKTKNAKGNISYTGSGFPGIKYKERQAANKKIDFKTIMAKLTWIYIDYYYNDIISTTRIKPLKDMIESVKDLFVKNGFLSKIDNIVKAFSAAEALQRKDSLTIKATAENPIMYATLMSMGLKFEGNYPMPHSTELGNISTWDTEKLLSESYKKSKDPVQHVCLTNPAFVVNIPAKEWRDFFIKVDKKKDQKSLYIKYFLWQNFNFPDTAFLFYFKVDITNISKVISKMFI